MDRRFRTVTVVGWSVLCLTVGLIGGGVLGFKLAGRVFDSLSQPLMTSAGVQALTVLSFLNDKQEGKARWLMESEVDNAIQILKDDRNRKDALSADVYQRLVKYRVLPARVRETSTDLRLRS